MKKIHTTLTALCLLVLSSGLALAQFQEEAGAKGTQSPKAKYAEVRIDINTADSEVLQQLPRVGPVIAERIVAFREEHGGFATPEEIMNVKGIGQKTFERLAPLIKVSKSAEKKE